MPPIGKVVPPPLHLLVPTNTHIPWMIVQVKDGLTYVTLFQKILAGAHPQLQLDEQLSCSMLNKVFVDHSEEYMCVVRKKLSLHDVCSVFGSHIKYLV